MDRVKIDNDLSVLNFPPEAHDMQNLAEAGFKTLNLSTKTAQHCCF